MSSGVFSQAKVLPVDEQGKYTFLEVNTVKSVSKELMAANARRFFKANAKWIKLKSNTQDTAFNGKGKMIIQKGLAGIGHPSAEVSYTLSISLREGKYRLILTDYVITPYERDRYGNFGPVTVSAPLEKVPGKLNRGEWDNNMAFVIDESKKIAEKLKVNMNNTLKDMQPEIKQQPAAVSTTKW